MPHVAAAGLLLNIHPPLPTNSVLSTPPHVTRNPLDLPAPENTRCPGRRRGSGPLAGALLGCDGGGSSAEGGSCGSGAPGQAAARGRGCVPDRPPPNLRPRSARVGCGARLELEARGQGRGCGLGWPCAFSVDIWLCLLLTRAQRPADGGTGISSSSSRRAFSTADAATGRWGKWKQTATGGRSDGAT